MNDLIPGQELGCVRSRKQTDTMLQDLGQHPTPDPQEKGPRSLLFLGVGNASPRCGTRACLMFLGCPGVEDCSRGRNEKHRNSTELLQCD